MPTEAEILAANPPSLYNPNNLDNPNITGWVWRERTNKWGEEGDGGGGWDDILFHPKSGAYKGAGGLSEADWVEMGGGTYDDYQDMGYEAWSQTPWADVRNGGVNFDGTAPDGSPALGNDPVDGGPLVIGGPIGPGGGGGGTDPGGGGTDPGESLDPDLNEPTDDWFWTDPVGYENAPQPDGDGSFVEGGPPPDTSWDWNFFRDKAPGDRQWGGYDEDYQAFERYQPGMDSPWGMPNIEGGNEDFYQQQFVNALRDEQGYQNRERAAQMRRQEAEANPYEGIKGSEMWDWAYGGKGLPEVRTNMGGPAPDPTYSLAAPFTTDSTLGDAIRHYAGTEGFTEYQENMRKWLDSGNESLDGTFWSNQTSPTAITQLLGSNDEGLTGKNREWLSKLANAMYQQNPTGPAAPVGYASPIGWGGQAPTG